MGPSEGGSGALLAEKEYLEAAPGAGLGGLFSIEGQGGFELVGDLIGEVVQDEIQVAIEEA